MHKQKTLLDNGRVMIVTFQDDRRNERSSLEEYLANSLNTLDAEQYLSWIEIANYSNKESSHLLTKCKEFVPGLVLLVASMKGATTLMIERHALSESENAPPVYPVYFSTMPVKMALNACLAAGLPAQISCVTDFSLANRVFMDLLQEFASSPTQPACGLVHHPLFVRAAAAERERCLTDLNDHDARYAFPSMAIETVAEGILAIIKAWQFGEFRRGAETGEIQLSVN